MNAHIRENIWIYEKKQESKKESLYIYTFFKKTIIYSTVHI